MRCLTITPNAAIDTTYVLPSLHTPGVNRVSRKVSVPGGKGNNVAKVLALLGHEVVASGFVAGRAGRFIRDGLDALGIEPRFLEVPGESRSCLTMVEEDSGAITEVLEPGVEIPAGAAEELLERASELARGVDAVVMSGSLPSGLDADYYARLIRAMRPSGAFLVLDTSGEALARGVEARPDLVKPNRDELAALMGRSADIGEVVEWVRGELPTRVLVSLGREGAALIDRDSALLATAPAVDVVNTVGAGDALLAGYLDGLPDEARALRQAVACGTAATLQLTAGAVDLRDVERLRERVSVQEIRRGH